MWKQSKITLFRGKGHCSVVQGYTVKTDSTADHTSESSFSKPQKEGVN